MYLVFFPQITGQREGSLGTSTISGMLIAGPRVAFLLAVARVNWLLISMPNFFPYKYVDFWFTILCGPRFTIFWPFWQNQGDFSSRTLQS
jgi:hypothetical protein